MLTKKNCVVALIVQRSGRQWGRREPEGYFCLPSQLRRLAPTVLPEKGIL